MAQVTRLSKAARELNVGISTIVEFLDRKGIKIGSDPNTKIEEDVYRLLAKEYSNDSNVKKASDELNLGRKKKESISIDDVEATDTPHVVEAEPELIIKTNTTSKPAEIKTVIPTSTGPKVLGKIDLDPKPKVPVQEPVKHEVKPQAEPEPEPQATAKAPQVAPAAKPEPEKVQAPVETKAEIEVQKPKVEHLHQTKIDPVEEPKVIGKIDLNALNQKTRPDKKSPKEREAERMAEREQRKNIPVSQPVQEPVAEKEVPEVTVPKPEVELYRAQATQLTGPKVLGKIELKEERRPNSGMSAADKKKKRKRIKKEKVNTDTPNQNNNTNTPNQGAQAPRTDANRPRTPVNNTGNNHNNNNNAQNKKVFGKKKPVVKPEVSEEDVQKQVKETLARLTSKQKSKSAKYRRDKRDSDRERVQTEIDRVESERNIIKVTEFVSVNELASMMDVPVTQVISTCMSLGLFVSINQRLDAETMALIADEFSYKVEFVSVEIQEAIATEVDTEEQLVSRSPIVTVMGHVDHGKTKLLDYVRRANVVAGEAGGITQHIGAYSVVLDDGRKITFLDTPGHEAFTAMRARGAQVTDVAIIVVAADDGIMPQTKEAINHAAAAGVPIVFAINKIDKPSANPDKIKEALSAMNYLVEEWGGKYQSQEISALTGLNVNELLEKVLLEAEVLELKANPNKRAIGSIIESQLDKGRGFVSTILVKAGTLKIGDVMLAGSYYGHVKAMFNERGKKVTEAGPSTPVQILGLNGAPPAGDNFNVMETDAEARNIANKREQLERQQTMRTKRHITLDEIGRRLAIGNFQELNVIIKGDVDGSIEALTDSIVKLSTEEIQVNVIHKAVGEISESDVLLANASNAIIIGFQVRPSMAARKLAEKEEIEIRLYSIIYDAINELKDAMTGMLSPEIREEIVANLEVREVFKITKVGTIAGCMVREGKIKRANKVRLIREGIVIYTGELGSLKRFKDDAKEVVTGLECGLNIDKYNDLKVGDIIEAFEQKEIARTL